MFKNLKNKLNNVKETIKKKNSIKNSKISNNVDTEIKKVKINKHFENQPNQEDIIEKILDRQIRRDIEKNIN